MSSSPQHEPSMEEILASIRKIISEDTGENQPPKQEADVLELTQEVQEEPAPTPTASPAPQPEAEAAPATLPSPQPEAYAAPAENNILFVSNEEASVSASVQQQQPEDNGIFSEKSRKAIDDAFAGLDATEEAAPRGTVAPVLPAVNGNSVEAVFERAVASTMQPLLHQWMDGRKDELLAAVKPLIRDWMDEHFPALLEGAVRDEVARVVKARGRR